MVKELRECSLEELNELHDAINDHKILDTPESLEHLLDELSDVQGTFTHLASLFGLYQSEMLHYCMDKVIGRKTDQNYKRFPTSNHNGINTMEAFIPGDHELHNNI